MCIRDSIGAVSTIQIKLNIESPWMPRFVVGYTTREIMLLEFSSSIMCLILSGKVGSNIASEIGTMPVSYTHLDVYKRQSQDGQTAYDFRNQPE